MDYSELMSKATAFIHKEYGEAILVEDISAHIHLSPSYFSFVFRTMTGFSVKEYLNRYRLYMAALELKETKKRIIEIVFDNGFTSQQAFTKSFSQAYGITPAKFRRLDISISSFPPSEKLPGRGVYMDIKQSFDNVQFERKESFFVIGIETDINYNGIGKGTDYISDLYERWNNENLLQRIPDQVNYKTIYGITHEETEDATAKYMIGTEVSTLENIPSGFIGRKFDACEYAVFHTTLDIVWTGEFWKYFFKTWAKEQNLDFPEIVFSKGEEAFTRYAAYEVYDDKWKDSSSVLKIYAPVLRK